MRVPATILRALRRAAGEYGIDIDLLAAIVRQESGFNPLAVGDIDVGPSLGLGQINLRGAGTAYRSNPSVLMLPPENARAAARYIRACTEAFPDDEARIISAYNGGVGNASRDDWWSVNGDNYVLPVAGYLTTIRREGLEEIADPDVPPGLAQYGLTLRDVAETLLGVCNDSLAAGRALRNELAAISVHASAAVESWRDR